VPPSPDTPTNGYSILKHLSRLKDVEVKLRNLACLVSCYPRRLGLWVFSATPGFESLSSLSQELPSFETNKLVIGSISLKGSYASLLCVFLPACTKTWGTVSASGHTTALDLIRSLSADPQVSSAGPSGPLRPQGAGPNTSRNGDGYGNFAAIYASFMSAVAGAINLQLVRRHNAIPLGARTLFTAVGGTNYDNATIANDDLNAFPALTSLRVELSQVGKVIVSLHTVCQNGITRLVGPGADSARRWDVQPHMDLWLAPNGTVARLISTNVDQSSILTPKPQNMRAANDGASQQVAEAKQRLWKATVLEWIANVGLPVSSIEEEIWVEVEVSEPFYTRLASEYLRQMDVSQPSYPLKRIVWPARYCFKRTRVPSATYFEGVGSSIKDSDDPLQFAEDWCAEAGSRNEKLASRSSALPQTQQNKDMSTPKADIPEHFESLARVAQYPDLQAASLVYPTPPDGALAQGMSQIGSDAFGVEGSDLVASQTPAERSVKREEQSSTKNRSYSDATSGFGLSTSLGVGSGLYDMNDEEDLFGGMNDKDFGSKGISDADFSFFDDPDFAALDKDNAKRDLQEYQQSEAPEVKTAPEVTPAEKSLDDENVTIDPMETDALKSSLTLDMSAKFPSKPQEIVSEDQESRSIQTMSPPLSPVEIKKILFPDSESCPGRANPDTIDSNARRHSNYGPIAFQPNLTMSDRKYGANGRFFFSENTKADTREDAQIPTVGLPQRGRKPRSENRSEYKTTDSQQQTPVHPARYRLRSPSVSSDGTTDDSSDDLSERAVSPTRFSGVKRKRPASQADESTTSSLERLSIASDVDMTTSKEESWVFLGNFLSVFSDWSLTGYFSTRQNQSSPVLIRKDDQIQLAQLMVDQVTQSSLCHKIDGCMHLPDLEHDTISLRTFLEDRTVMGDIERLDLKTYVSLQESASVVINESSANRQNTQRKDVKGSITKLPSPHLRIHRGRDFLELLPPAVSFWETFGLEPANGAKDISAYCVYPQYAKEGADTFLDRLGLLYSSCNLGKHVRGDRSKAFENGLGSWPVTLAGDSGYLATMQSLRTLCEGLGMFSSADCFCRLTDTGIGTALSKAPPVRDNFVIYIINPFSHGAALADICSAFLLLFQKYIGDVDRHQARHQLNELVLQVIPMSFISSPSSIVVPTETEYLNLALEVYNRCAVKDTTSSVMGCAPPVLLAESVPKAINFKLAPERTSPFQEGKCLHLALSRSLDQRWISAAWSDSSGSFQLTMSYCLRSRGSNVSRMLTDVRHEIWETTKDIMERTQTRWKIFLVRTEPIDQEEIDGMTDRIIETDGLLTNLTAWNYLVERYNQLRSMSVELTVLSVNIAPGLRLELPPSQMQLNSVNPQTSSTPVTTPHAGIPSPDQFGGSVATPASGGQGPANAATPTELSSVIEPDSDAVLIDASDESWAVILSHRLSNSPFITEYRPALVSGYLLRRNGVSDSQGVLAMSVNLVYTQRPVVSYESLLREALGMYRDLATLARAKGTLHVQRNTLPWHIATAVKGQELLSYIL
jgi:mediator of RNA polymerase II transcription subunit 13